MNFTRKTLRKKISNEQGQAIVEFAIIFPLFIFIFAGFVYLGMVFHDYLSITYFTREAARSSAVGVTKDDIQTDATTNHRLMLTNLYSVNLAKDFSLVVANDANLGGDFVTVTVTARKNAGSSLAIIDSFLPDTLSNKLSMRVETKSGS